MKEKDNVLLERTFELSKQSIEIYRVLQSDCEFVLSKQFLKCSTAPGAMAHEAQSAQSTRDFISKLEIGLKELRESSYWIRLMVDSGFLKKEDVSAFKQTQKDCLRLFISIINTSKKKLNN